VFYVLSQSCVGLFEVPVLFQKQCWHVRLLF